MRGKRAREALGHDRDVVGTGDDVRHDRRFLHDEGDPEALSERRLHRVVDHLTGIAGAVDHRADMPEAAELVRGEPAPQYGMVLSREADEALLGLGTLCMGSNEKIKVRGKDVSSRKP